MLFPAVILAFDDMQAKACTSCAKISVTRAELQEWFK